ncbi:hypothetical protein GCM10022254_10130 [Actinomadura meridiana]|uniref:Peptidase C51 domain-containing protein n=2 Tax=Actinomadura meridiana TaxID=559626 RepID=A0ABP8BTU9_9ACTN
MLAEARATIGMSGRPNEITKEYAARHGDEFLRANWCDMAITYWARHSGNASAVLPGGDRAYTPWHAGDFQKVGRWHSGTAANVNQAKPGDIVFFDWGATDRVSAIDHVGVVEKVLGGGRVQTVEANTSDAVCRRVRSSGVIAGYGRPDYGGSSTSQEDPVIGLKEGDKGEAVVAAQRLVLYAGGTLPRYGVDGEWGDEMSAGLLQVRKSMGSDVKDAREMTGTAYAQLMRAVARAEAAGAGGGPAVDVGAEVRRYLEGLHVRLDVT